MTTLPPPDGENPSLTAEEIEALKNKPGSTLTAANTAEVEDISTLTQKLLSQNLTGEAVEIHEARAAQAPQEEEPAPSSMIPERLATTNRPPSMEDIADIHFAFAKKPQIAGGASAPTEDERAAGASDAPAKSSTAYCVEGDED